jgi:flagellar hook-associated protein 2
MATDAISALGAGSGMDIKALTTSLVDAERAPHKDAINKKIAKSESAISGYGSIKYVLQNLNTAFNDLKDQSDFSSIGVQNSQSNSVSVTANSTASAGSHQVTVTSLAKADRFLSNGFSNTNAINGGQSFNLSLSVNGTSQGNITIPANQDTPSGIVTAINAANKGVTAQLIATGDTLSPYKIMVTGTTGASQGFQLSSAIAGLNFGNQIQSRANAVVNIDGIEVTPSSNQLVNFFPGVTFDLLAPTSSVTTSTTNGAGVTSMVSTPVPANINLTRDTSSVKTKIQALVQAYNDASSMLKTVSDPKSTVETYGASLVGDSLVYSLRNQLRDLVFSNSNTPSGTITNMRDLGISVDMSGGMTLDTAKLDKVLSTQFDNVVAMMSGSTEGLSAYSTQNAGAAGTAIRKLNSLISSTGLLNSQTTSINNKITDYKLELTKLEDRMERLKDRYTKQFSAMEGIVGQSKSLRTNLTSTFEGMMAAYTNK